MLREGQVIGSIHSAVLNCRSVFQIRMMLKGMLKKQTIQLKSPQRIQMNLISKRYKLAK